MTPPPLVSLLRRDVLLQRHRSATAGRLLRLDADERARLIEPHGASRQLPATLAGDRRVPAYRLVLDIHALIVCIEQLDAMAVGVAHVNEKRETGAMPARAVLDIVGKAHLGSQI